MARTFDREAQESHRQAEDQRCCTVYANDPAVFSVDKILNIRGGKTKIEYLVAWTGYPEQYNQWVLEQNVTTDLKRAFSLANKEKVIKSLKKKRVRKVRRKHLKTETSTKTIRTSSNKEENEFSEEPPSQFELSLLKKELNEGNVTPKFATLSG